MVLLIEYIQVHREVEFLEPFSLMMKVIGPTTQNVFTKFSWKEPMQ